MIQWFQTRRAAPACHAALFVVAGLLPAAAGAGSAPPCHESAPKTP